MRRLTGTYDGQEYVIREYDTGLIECPEDLRPTLQMSDGRLPHGERLEHECRLLFGESFQVREE